MRLGLENKTALVTGSSGGVGSGIAIALASEGCRVLVHGRDRHTAEEVADQIRGDGGEADIVLGDLSDPTEAVEVCAAVAAAGVDILVANAGPFAEHSWDDVEPEHWVETFTGNVVSAARVIKAVVPAMRTEGWGRIVTVGSRAATTPLPNMVEYSAAKAAVVNMTVSLAQHLAGSGVTANCVSPGVILTPSLRRMFADRAGDEAWTESAVTADYAPNPVGRLGRPDDIAGAVLYLASRQADYVTGLNLRVDGGITGAV